MVTDEIAFALTTHAARINDFTLKTVAKHIKSSNGKPGNATQTINLIYVFGHELSHAMFLEDFNAFQVSFLMWFWFLFHEFRLSRARAKNRIELPTFKKTIFYGIWNSCPFLRCYVAGKTGRDFQIPFKNRVLESCSNLFFSLGFLRDNLKNWPALKVFVKNDFPPRKLPILNP